MELYQVDPTRELNKEAVTSITSGVVYYVSMGRNAWNSTWISQYKKGCMHTTIESAKDYSEKNRVSGTVFYIRQLPCLVFRTETKTLIVTEINNNIPLSGYSADALTSTADNAQNIKNQLENYIQIGAPLLGVGLSFLNTSRFWHKKPRSKDSIMLLSIADNETPIEKAEQKEFTALLSSSSGSKYYLSWSPMKSHISGSAIYKIINGIDQNISSETTSTAPLTERTGNVEAKVHSLHEPHMDEAYSTKVRLRKISLIRGHKGSPEARDSAIREFLEELSQVLTFRSISRMNDDVLALNYERWIEAVMRDTDTQERVDWMVSSVNFFLFSFTCEA